MLASDIDKSRCLLESVIVPTISSDGGRTLIFNCTVYIYKQDIVCNSKRQTKGIDNRECSDIVQTIKRLAAEIDHRR